MNNYLVPCIISDFIPNDLMYTLGHAGDCLLLAYPFRVKSPGSEPIHQTTAHHSHKESVRGFNLTVIKV